MAANGPPIKFSKDVSKHVQEFKSLSQLAVKRLNSRYNGFVITLGAIPNIPRRHPGVDDEFSNKGIELESLDSLQRGQTALKYVQEGAKQKCYPKLIFLSGSIQDEDNYTQFIHEGHTFSDCKKFIQEEKQLPIEFHFSGHGDPEKVGSVLSENRVSGDALADFFDQLMHVHGLRESLIPEKKDKQKALHFNFHVCNSAYVDIEENDSNETIRERILKESVIGKFFRQMQENGYRNIQVTGYRGYYQIMDSGKGCRVINKITAPDLDIAADDARYVIQSKGEHGIDVQLPRNGKFAITFPGQRLRAGL